MNTERHHEMSESFIARLFVFLKEKSVFLKDDGDKSVEMLELVLGHFLEIYDQIGVAAYKGNELFLFLEHQFKIAF